MAAKPSSVSASEYSEGSIRVLKGLEPVKQRPGMYTRTDNPLHIIQEVLDNAADEALAGYGKKIKVTLHTDGSVSIEDDGRGIPFGMHPEEKAPVIELVFTRLHAGGKFDKGKGGAYSFSGGLHGVGVSVTNALSTRLEVTVYREGEAAHLVFAGGDVVHITSGVSGLVLALVVGKRRDYDRLEYRPHNVPFVLLGAALLWFGWFGFNAGSSLAADGLAVHALITTHFSAAAAMFSWMMVEKVTTGKPSLVGASTGLVAGLVAITPGAGFVSVWSSLLIGLLVSPICYFAIAVLKAKFGYDDALDAFGCHGVGRIFGGIVTGIFTLPSLALDKANVGWLYGSPRLLLVTLAAIAFTVVWSALVTFVIIKVIGIFMPLRVSDREEAIGLDDSEHEETAYPTFMGLDS